MAQGRIFEIKHFAVHDGPGIRTTVFFKGCPLRCLWCHNPEGLSCQAQLSYVAQSCQHCMACVSSCPQKAHGQGSDGKHLFLRERCVACGRCAESCPSAALSFYGKTVTVASLLGELLEDREFYEASEGGVTLSGGECLMQAEFCAELLAALKQEGIHTAVDTCGFVPKAALEQVVKVTDLFLYDLKAVDEECHLRCTGQSNARILENLFALGEWGKAVEIRIPYVPGQNGDQMEKMGRLLGGLPMLTGVRVLPYHSYAEGKYRALGIEPSFCTPIPTEQELQSAKECLRSFGIKILE